MTTQVGSNETYKVVTQLATRWQQYLLTYCNLLNENAVRFSFNEPTTDTITDH